MNLKTKHEIAKVIQRFLPAVELQGGLSGHQRSLLKLMSLCKTSALGGHLERCDQCSHKRVHYNSCGNRNSDWMFLYDSKDECPRWTFKWRNLDPNQGWEGQGVNKEKWIFNRQQDLLPVKYFHCVFTIPSELYIYFRYNKKLLYDLQLRCVKDTLLAFGMDPKHGISGKIGAIITHPSTSGSLI